MKVNQSFLRILAALMILIYHVWAFVSQSVVEEAIVKVMFVGVDIFFFLSAFSMANKKISYANFVLTKVVRVYLKFVLFAALYNVYNGLSLLAFIKNITGISLFEVGGGAFLWFAPAIIIFYFLFPLFHMWKAKYKWAYVLLAWFAIGVIITSFTDYSAPFILLNRIPVMLLGYYCKKMTKPNNLFFGIASLLVGLVLLFIFGYRIRLHVPIYDIYFVFALPFIFGLAMLSGFIKDNKIARALSAPTFELYGLQMIFGADLTNELLFVFDQVIICNFITIIALCVAAYALYLIFKYLESSIEKLVNTRKTA